MPTSFINNIKSLDLEKLDYDKMTPMEFIEAERQAQVLIRRLKQNNNVTKRKLVKIYNNYYEITFSDYKKLKDAKEEDISTVKAEIVVKYQPVELEIK